MLKSSNVLKNGLFFSLVFVFLLGSVSANPALYYKAANTNVVISSDTTLVSDLICGNLTIYKGVTLNTNGFNIYCSGTVTNNGVITTGYRNDALGPKLYAGSQGTSFPSSFGGSGGGGGSGWGGAGGFYSGNGGNTLVAGGAYTDINTASGGNGSTPNVPFMSKDNIINWYSSGFQNYISGGGGGQDSSTGGRTHPCPYSGASTYGVYIQANKIAAGMINAVGINGNDSSEYCGEPWDPGGAGSGGGVIMLSYGSGGYIAGTYDVAGGTVGSPYNQTGTGGAGGAGQVATYSYGNDAPIVILPSVSGPTTSTLISFIAIGIAVATAVAAVGVRGLRSNRSRKGRK
ncbi:MAG: hypothetical protein ABSD68_00060 [Candidatus Micrarchaeales archaeon]|jgi:hypothetical protein